MNRLMTATLAGILVALAPAASDAQIVPRLDRPLQRPLQTIDPLRERARDPLEEIEPNAVESVTDPADEVVDAAEESAAEARSGIDETAGEVAAGARALQEATGDMAASAAGVAGQLAGAAGDTLTATLRAFELAAAPDGWPVEARTVIAIVSDDELDRIDALGLDVISRRTLPSLGGTLVTFREPTAAPLTTTLTTVRTSLPGSSADFNHVYRAQAQAQAQAQAETAAGPSAADEPVVAGAARKLRIGLVDSAVDVSHFSLAETEIDARSFVTHEGSEPTSHGTAVASLLARAADGNAGVLSASVFFQAPNYAPGATTESLVAALDWLVGERVDAINMSLAGPPNDLLQAVLESLGDRGPAIVAAVGNNGPNGDPMYPAAYEGVIGVTAVDRDRDIWIYSNRGDYVDFAALGVDVKVADAGAGWRIESGTSMASPVLAVVAAAVAAEESLARSQIVDRMAASAEDLGQKGFDSVYGHGYLAGPPVLLSGRTGSLPEPD